MADLNVQPKKTSMLPWIIVIALAAIALIYFLTRNKDDDAAEGRVRGTDTTDTRSADNQTALNEERGAAVAATAGWEGVNYNAPAANYDEISDRDIEVRSDDNYTIYSLGENILFDVDKSSIRSGAAANMKQIAESIRKRYDENEIRVYGFTDARGSKNYNKQLAEDRAAAVKAWLVKDGDIKDNRISIHPVGEARPAKTNASAEGRRENRRVEIVVKRS